jgi:hypothetical protein
VRPQSDAVDAIPSGCDDAPAFVLRHGVGHGADANCHVGIGAVPALRYRHLVIATADRLSGAARQMKGKIPSRIPGIGRQRRRSRCGDPPGRRVNRNEGVGGFEDVRAS